MRTVFISFPKSGRTWMRYIVHLLGSEVIFTHAGYRSSGKKEIGRRFSGVQTSVIGEKNIFMYRDPLDTAISLYFQIHNSDFARGNKGYFKKFIRLALLGRLPPKDISKFVLHPVWGVENICRFNRGWIDYLGDKPNSLIIQYEDAKKDTALTIQKLADFIGISEYDAQDIATKSSFDEMKKLELTVGKSKELRLYGKKSNNNDSMKVRRGVVAGYKEYLDESVIEKARVIAAEFNFKLAD